MNTTKSAPDDTPAGRLLKIRHELVDRIWQGLLVVALLGAPASAARSLTTGWLPLYGFHLGMALMVVAVYWFRARMPFAAKSALLILSLWSVGLAGAFSLGMLGTAYWWLVLSSLLVSTLYSVRAGVITALAVAALLALTGIGFTTGALKVSVDANAYITSGAAWVNLLFTTLVAPFIVFTAIAAYQKTTLELLEEVHRQRDRIELLATHDQLTGLPLPSLMADRLQVALRVARRSDRKVALLFLDLDGFKTVNDTLGHAAGDQVLKEVAARLLKAVRGEDTVARVGGDEFVVILGGLADKDVAARVAGRAIAAISRPIDCAGAQVSVGSSIGIGLYPDHAKDAQALQQVADAAMYAVKKSGKNSFAFADRAQAIENKPQPVPE